MSAALLIIVFFLFMVYCWSQVSMDIPCLNMIFGSIFRTKETSKDHYKSIHPWETAASESKEPKNGPRIKGSTQRENYILTHKSIHGRFILTCMNLSRQTGTENTHKSMHGWLLLGSFDDRPRQEVHIIAPVNKSFWQWKNIKLKDICIYHREAEKEKEREKEKGRKRKREKERERERERKRKREKEKEKERMLAQKLDEKKKGNRHVCVFLQGTQSLSFFSCHFTLWNHDVHLLHILAAPQPFSLVHLYMRIIRMFIITHLECIHI